MVDATRFALVSSGVKTEMLLHTPRAHTHAGFENKQKSAPLKEALFYDT